MIVDEVGWFIFVCAIAFLSAGCIFTQAPKPVEQALDNKIDRAA